MPCYTVRKLSVEFKAKHVDLLKEACKQLGWKVEEDGDLIRINYTRITINLKTNKAEAYNQSEINKLKQAYSKKAIEKVAAKKKWLLKQGSNNKMQLKRF